MSLEVVTVADGDALAAAGAGFVLDRIHAAAASGRTLRVAVSGGRTPWSMLERIAAAAPPWDAFELWQVDERIAPDGDGSRNLTHLRAALPNDAVVHPMPVTADDPERAAADYADSLPDRFDLVHLGLGTDGHTASLVPGDPVLDVRNRRVALTPPYQGHRRMTLTLPVLDAAHEVLWLVGGAAKQDAVRRLIARDRGIPAGRVAAERQVLLVDAEAAGR